MMIDQSKSQDKIFFETGEAYENEEFESALLYYSQKDAEVAQHLQQYMMQMQQHAPPGAGGMWISEWAHD